MMEYPLIRTEGIKKVYRMGKVEVYALRGVNLVINEGEYVAIMGPSGSGKSTLMHILGCLDRPTEGKYYLEGKEVQSLDESQLADIRKKTFGFVFQTFNLLPRLDAHENVELPMAYARVPSKIRHIRAMQLLKTVGLKERAHHKPTELSGGEAQRVAIARALANDPKVLLADEPTGNLDTKTGIEVLTVFKKLHQQGRTIVVVTHDPEVAAEAQRIIYLRDGKIVPHL